MIRTDYLYIYKGSRGTFKIQKYSYRRSEMTKDKVEIFNEIMDDYGIPKEVLDKVYDVGYGDGYDWRWGFKPKKIIEKYFYEMLKDEVLELNQRYFPKEYKQLFPKSLPTSVSLELQKLWETDLKPQLFGSKVDGGKLVQYIESMVECRRDEYDLRDMDEYVDMFMYEHDENGKSKKIHLTKDDVKKMVEEGIE